jgi:meiosis-specific serine/threonine-protein kinase MEK1
MHNERKVSKGTVVLCDGDRLEIGGQVFRWSQPGRQVNASHESAPVAKEKIGNYIVFNRLLGSGAFSVVHLAFNTKVNCLSLCIGRRSMARELTASRSKTLTQVACKKITRKKMIKESLMSVQREVEILKTVSHPNINKVEDVVVSELDVYVFIPIDLARATLINAQPPQCHFPSAARHLAPSDRPCPRSRSSRTPVSQEAIFLAT